MSPSPRHRKRTRSRSKRAEPWAASSSTDDTVLGRITAAGVIGQSLFKVFRWSVALDTDDEINAWIHCADWLETSPLKVP